MTACFDKSDNSDDFESAYSLMVTLGVMGGMILDSPQSKSSACYFPWRSGDNSKGVGNDHSKGYAFADHRGVSED